MNKTKYTISRINNSIHMTPQSYTKVLLWMHGLGDSADGFLPLFESFPCVPSDYKIVLLNAENRPVTLNFGMTMPSWYDIKTLDLTDEKAISQQDVEESAKRVITYVEEEVKNVKNDFSKIFLGGFSQGASMSLYIGFEYPQHLGGIISLSGALFPFINLGKYDRKKLPILCGHGTKDMMIPYKIAMESYKRLEGYSFEIKSYDVDHTVDVDKELVDVREFLAKF